MGVKGMESEGEEAEARLGWVWRGWGLVSLSCFFRG